MKSVLPRVSALLAAWLLVACASAPAPATSTIEIEPTPPGPPATEAPADGSEPCRHAVSGDSPVARACRQGGVPAAKATMKDLVREGRAAGLKLGCDDCHVDTGDFAHLAADAPERLKHLLATIGRR